MQNFVTYKALICWFFRGAPSIRLRRLAEPVLFLKGKLAARWMNFAKPN
jgi:hypothetical protein